MASEELPPPPVANFPISSPAVLAIDALEPLTVTFPGGTTQYFSFDVATPGSFTIIATAFTTEPALTMELGTVTGTSGSEAFNTITTDSDGLITYDIDTVGTYTLEIVNSGDTGVVSVFVNSDGGTAPPLYTISSPGIIPVDAPTGIPDFPADSTQYFTFSITTPGAYTIICDAVSSGAVLTMKLGTVSGDPGAEIFQELASDVDGVIGYDFETAGTFFLEVVNSGTSDLVIFQVNSPGGTPPEDPPAEPIAISGDMYDPVAIQINQPYVVNDFSGNEEQGFTFTLPEYGPYYVEYTTTGGMDPALAFIAYTDTGGGYSYSYIKSDTDGFLYHSFVSDDLMGYTTFALTISNTGTLGTITFAIKEMTTPPPVSVDGTITPSEMPGTTGGLEFTVSEDEYDVWVFSFDAIAGKTYSAAIYQILGENQAPLDCRFTDAYSAGERWHGPSGQAFSFNMDGLPLDIYEATSDGVHYLNVKNWTNYAGSYIIKIFSNTPAAPGLSPNFISENTTTPQAITLTANNATSIYYSIVPQELYYDEAQFSTYDEPFLMDIIGEVFAYAIKDGVYSGLSSGYYVYAGTKDPGFSPDGSLQPEGTVISITGAIEGDAVYYTTDGSNPYNSATRQVYTEASSITIGAEGLYLTAIIQNSNGVY
ncbi:MAG: chitobiase/beta-hexosaminidase C-terminal domain-containing protein, partial [Eubacteriales bacterium]|nr:chitobiase/beta-hexosaminidase C-terminal domain-containing protein [Eubacteriales bacterium]